MYVSGDVCICGCMYVCGDVCTGWAGQSWTKTFFSMYRPSCLIQAFGGPEKYWLEWAGPLANHPFNFNLIS
jgi:hypothetical protein